MPLSEKAMAKRRAYNREYKKNNPEKCRAWSAKYRKNNPEKVKVLGLENYKKNKEKQKSAARVWYHTNKEKSRNAGRKWRKNNPEKQKIKQRRSNLIKNYGITIEDYDRMYLDQWGMCPICGDSKKSASMVNVKTHEVLHVDHNHTTGKVRALICSRCNFLLGNARENKAILQNAKDYLEYFSEREGVLQCH